MGNKGYLNHAINISVILLSTVIFILDYEDTRGGFLQSKLFVRFDCNDYSYLGSHGKGRKTLSGII